MKPANRATDFRRGVDHIGVTACFVVHDGKGRVCLHKRSKNCRDEQGTWDNGGGAVEFGETFEEAIRREVKEELGADCLELQFLKAYEVHRKHQGVPTHWIAHTYAVLVDPSSVRNAEPFKIDEIGWFNLNNLPTPMHSQTPRDLDAATSAGVLK